MFLEEGVCALCGKKLGEDYERDRWNNRFHYCALNENNVYQNFIPYFCSDAHVATMADTRKLDNYKPNPKLTTSEQLYEDSSLHVRSHELAKDYYRNYCIARTEYEKRKLNEQDQAEYQAQYEEEEALRGRYRDLRDIPFECFFEHVHILAAPGSGKTTLLQAIILYYLSLPNPPALVIVDPKGLMMKRLRALSIFDPTCGKLWDRLIVVDPTDAIRPSLGLFAPPNPNLPAAIRQRIQNRTTSLLEYIFGASNFKLTPKQSVGFSFLARLMFAIPNANFFTLLDVIEEEVDPSKGQVSKYAQYMEQLDPAAQRFFKKDFYGEFNETKSQIKPRLYFVLESPELSAIFNAPTQEIDWFDCIQTGKIVLVNTGLYQLSSDEASEIFGRYVIASVVAAAGARSAIPQSQWKPAFLMIDEAQLFVDEHKTQEMLNLMREYRLGITLSQQQMTGVQMNENLRSSISTCTSVKFAANLGGRDLTNAANDLQTTPEFILDHGVTPQHVEFACFARNSPMKTAFTVQIPRGNLGYERQMPKAHLMRLIENNYRRVTGKLKLIPTQARICKSMIEIGQCDEYGNTDGLHRYIVEGTKPGRHEKILLAPEVTAQRPTTPAPPKIIKPESPDDYV